MPSPRFTVWILLAALLSVGGVQKPQKKNAELPTDFCSTPIDMSAKHIRVVEGYSFCILHFAFCISP